MSQLDDGFTTFFMFLATVSATVFACFAAYAFRERHLPDPASPCWKGLRLVCPVVKISELLLTSIALWWCLRVAERSGATDRVWHLLVGTAMTINTTPEVRTPPTLMILSSRLTGYQTMTTFARYSSTITKRLSADQTMVVLVVINLAIKLLIAFLVWKLPARWQVLPIVVCCVSEHIIYGIDTFHHCRNERLRQRSDRRKYISSVLRIVISIITLLVLLTLSLARQDTPVTWSVSVYPLSSRCRERLTEWFSAGVGHAGTITRLDHSMSYANRSAE